MPTAKKDQIKKLKKAMAENKKLIARAGTPYLRDSIRQRNNILKKKVKELTAELKRAAD